MKKETLLINGIQSKISKNKSEGKDWNIVETHALGHTNA
ncbi:hypothetical protein AA20_12015 [Aliarcobacter butzleri L348]|uniref:Uncharacterized protein n=1 Tax=Aliarcobacter butzleri L348 TaxID=1447256 RepID=A0A0G9JWT0_9BACT|nr:hypothetical protein AA20_12015 [Aliarcobacter butzleri L348]